MATWHCRRCLKEWTTDDKIAAHFHACAQRYDDSATAPRRPAWMGDRESTRRARALSELVGGDEVGEEATWPR